MSKKAISYLKRELPGLVRTELSLPTGRQGLGSSFAAPAKSGQLGDTTFHIEASKTALRLVRMAVEISVTPEEQFACMRAFVSQANRLLDLSGEEAPQ